MAALGPEGRKQLKKAGGVLALGIEMGLSVIVGILGGQYLDERFGSEPAMALLGMLFGLAASSRALVREVRNMRSEVAEKNDSSGGRSGGGGSEGSEEEKTER